MFRNIVAFISIFLLSHQKTNIIVEKLRYPGDLWLALIIAFLGLGLLLTGRSASSPVPSSASFPPPAYSGVSMFELSVAELTTEADRILVANVLAVQSQFNAEGTNIDTEVTLAVDRVFKGSAETQETITLPGGQVGDIKVMIGGVPNFAVGERTLLFLDDDSEFTIAGLWQGKYSLSGDEAYQPETGQSIPVSTLEQEISQALAAPVEIGTSPQLIQAQYVTFCAPWAASGMPVPHYVNPSNPGPGIPADTTFVRVAYDALQAWQSLSNSWPSFQVVGTTTRTATNVDGFNDIAWSGTLGMGIAGLNNCIINSGVRVESDTRFSNDLAGWEWTLAAEPSKIALRSVTEHEFGHGIGLDHSDQCPGTDLNPVMCIGSGNNSGAGVRKTIQADDINGAASLYPLSGSPPAAPSGLSVTSGGTSYALTWTDNANNEHAFEIQRASGSCSGTFVGVATVPANTTNFTDNDYGMGLSGNYCYRVKALNQGGDSGFSNAAGTAQDITKRLDSTSEITSTARITYSITIINYEALALANTTMSDIIPNNTTYVPGSAVANPAIISFNNFPTSSTDPFDFPANSSVTITYALTVGTVFKGDILTNTAILSAPTLAEALQAVKVDIVDPVIIYLPAILKN